MLTLQNGWSGELILHKKKPQSSNPVGVICNAKSSAVSSNTCSLFPESWYSENGNIACRVFFRKENGRPAYCEPAINVEKKNGSGRKLILDLLTFFNRRDPRSSAAKRWQSTLPAISSLPGVKSRVGPLMSDRTLNTVALESTTALEAYKYS